MFFLYLSTFATFVVFADPHCIFCQLVQEREDLGGGGGGQWSVRPPRMWAVG